MEFLKERRFLVTEEEFNLLREIANKQESLSTLLTMTANEFKDWDTCRDIDKKNIVSKLKTFAKRSTSVQSLLLKAYYQIADREVELTEMK